MKQKIYILAALLNLYPWVPLTEAETRRKKQQYKRNLHERLFRHAVIYTLLFWVCGKMFYFFWGLGILETWNAVFWGPIIANIGFAISGTICIVYILIPIARVITHIIKKIQD